MAPNGGTILRSENPVVHHLDFSVFAVVSLVVWTLRGVIGVSELLFSGLSDLSFLQLWWWCVWVWRASLVEASLRSFVALLVFFVAVRGGVGFLVGGHRLSSIGGQ